MRTTRDLSRHIRAGVIRYFLSQASGFALVAFGLAVLFSALFWLLAPRGEVRELSGTVLRMAFREDYEGSQRVAVVLVEGREVTIRLPMRARCDTGDTIALQQTSVRIGTATRVARANPRPCG